MSRTPADPDFEPRIADWLEDDPDHAPAAVLGTVLAAFPSIPQRRASRVPWRFQPMNRFALVGAAAAVVAAVGVGGAAPRLPPALARSRPRLRTDGAHVPPIAVARSSPTAPPRRHPGDDRRSRARALDGHPSLDRRATRTADHRRRCLAHPYGATIDRLELIGTERLRRDDAAARAVEVRCPHAGDLADRSRSARPAALPHRLADRARSTSRALVRLTAARAVHAPRCRRHRATSRPSMRPPGLRDSGPCDPSRTPDLDWPPHPRRPVAHVLRLATAPSRPAPHPAPGARRQPLRRGAVRGRGVHRPKLAALPRHAADADPPDRAGGRGSRSRRPTTASIAIG